MSEGLGDSGSAPVDFLAFGLPTLALILASSQLLIGGYLSNVAFDAANEGAQALAFSDGSIASAHEKVAKVVNSLAPVSTFQTDAAIQSTGTVSLSLVTVHLSNPMGLFGGQRIAESASVADETN